MTPCETASTLRLFNAWRRGDEEISQPDPYEIGRAIDSAVEALDEVERLRAQNAILIAKAKAKRAGKAAKRVKMLGSKT